MTGGIPFDPDTAEQDGGDDEADLWFLPGPEEDPETPPGVAPARPAPALFDPTPWHAAQEALSAELAEVAMLFGSLDAVLRRGPEGWRHRLALREASDLSWWAGDRLGVLHIALWIALRIGSTDDTEHALANAGWAVRRLTVSQGPMPDLRGFLERPLPAAAESVDADVVPEDRVDDLAQVVAAGQGLHPIVQAARVFHAWRVLGPAGSAPIEAAVLAARIGAGMARKEGQGALFLPLAQTGAGALKGAGDPAAKLRAWLRGAERATLAALLHLERLAEWRRAADRAIADMNGRTAPLLLDLMEQWPLVSAPLAEGALNISRASAQRNLTALEKRGLIREVSHQARYRVWSAGFGG